MADCSKNIAVFCDAVAVLAEQEGEAEGTEEEVKLRLEEEGGDIDAMRHNDARDAWDWRRREATLPTLLENITAAMTIETKKR